ncbi:hypothetical protein D3C80_2017450 [compost metagenome]
MRITHLNKMLLVLIASTPHAAMSHGCNPVNPPDLLLQSNRAGRDAIVLNAVAEGVQILAFLKNIR